MKRIVIYWKTEDLKRKTEVKIEDEVEVEVEPQKIVKNVPADFEAFEYFVDFDEPEGEALTDDDLYN